MLEREIFTPVEMVVGRPPEASLESPGLECARKLRDGLDSAREFAKKNPLPVAGARQKKEL